MPHHADVDSNPLDVFLNETAAQFEALAKPWQSSSSRALILDLALCQLFHYPAAQGEWGEVPESSDVLFIVYAMVNTASILDLQKNVSTIERLQQQGVTVYLMEWKPPTPAQSSLGLYDYLQQSLDVCVQQALQHSGVSQLNLMGVCQGGVFSLCYAALYPQRIRSVIPVVTPVDFHTEADVLSQWVRDLDIEVFCKAGMNIPGKLLAQVFLLLKPMTLTVRKYLDIAQQASQQKNAQQLVENFMAMEQWIEHSPDQPAQFFWEFVRTFYQQNALYKSSLRLGDQDIDLRTLSMPVLNIYAAKDHLVPPESSRALEQLIQPDIYQSLEVPTGHIGMFVSQKSLSHVPEAIAVFIRQS